MIWYPRHAAINECIDTYNTIKAQLALPREARQGDWFDRRRVPRLGIDAPAAHPN